MLWLLNFLLNNKYLVGAVAILAVLAGVFFFGMKVGGDMQRVACYNSIERIKKAIADEKAKVDKANEEWQRRIITTTEHYNQQLELAEQVNTEQAAKLQEYENEVNNAEDKCRPIDQRDIDSLRRK